MSDFYQENEDYKRFIDLNAKQYNKTVEFMKLTPTAKEYEKYLREILKLNVTKPDDHKNT